MANVNYSLIDESDFGNKEVINDFEDLDAAWFYLTGPRNAPQSMADVTEVLTRWREAKFMVSVDLMRALYGWAWEHDPRNTRK